MQLAVILLMIVAYVAYYAYNKRWSISQYMRSSSYDRPEGMLRADLVDCRTDVTEMDKKLAHRLIFDPDSIIEEFRDDLIEIYGETRYADRFEEDRIKWKTGKWTAPGLDVLLRDNKKTKSEI